MAPIAKPSTLVVLLDHSTSHAERQLPWALLLCRSMDVPLVLMNMVDPARTSDPIGIALADAADYLELIAWQIRRQPAAPDVTTEVREGLPDEEWREYSREHPGAVLMMPGWAGAESVRGLRVRPAEELASAFTTPVIVIPAGAPPPAKISRIVVGTDGSPLSEAILESARALAGQDVETIEVEAIERGNLPDHEYLLLRPLISENRVSIRGKAGPVVLAVARMTDADLIVVGTHGKGALRAILVGSTSRWLVRNTDRPVVIVPEAWAQEAGARS